MLASGTTQALFSLYGNKTSRRTTLSFLTVIDVCRIGSVMFSSSAAVLTTVSYRELRFDTAVVTCT